jgi:Flp pilus assembly pilin Flp
MMVLKRLWNDEAGFVVSTELVLLATVAVVGLITGITAVRDGVVSELSDVAGAVQEVNQSYSYDGVVGHNAASAGTQFIDNLDECDSADDPAGVADNCITFDQPSVNEVEPATQRNAPAT